MQERESDIGIHIVSYTVDVDLDVRYYVHFHSIQREKMMKKKKKKKKKKNGMEMKKKKKKKMMMNY